MINRQSVAGLLVAVGAACFGVMGDAKPARACGGCFGPPTEVTVVNEHRMVFSIGKTQTVLWDQIKYSGDPKEFAWVLPVRQGAKLELSHEEFMSALDAYTQPVVIGPTPPPSKGPAFGCGSYSVTIPDYATPGAGVNVVSQQVVGPYEVVTLRATDSTALETWLKSHQYNIPAAIQPTVDSYVKEKFDFIALRLLPNKGVGAMEPVRVVTQGPDPTLPLRMVAAGVGQNVGVLLYVIGEGRYHTANFRDVNVDDRQLVWDSAASKSNYSTLADTAMTGGDSRGVLTEFAGHAVHNDFTAPSGAGFGTPYFSSLDQAYQNAIQTSSYSNQGKCTPNPFDSGNPFVQDSGNTSPDSSVPDFDGSAPSDGGAADGDVGDSSTVSDSSVPDANLPPVDTSCTFDDLTVATKDMRPGDVWVTRLRMHLPVAALSDDLRLEASSPQTLVDNFHKTNTTTADSGGCSESGNSNNWTGLALGALGAVLVARRRRRQA